MHAVLRILATTSLLVLTAISFAQPESDSQRLAKGIAALADPIPKVAYSKFSELYVITSPHPDAGMQRFVKRSQDGDADAFAFVAFMVWQGYSGFRQDRAAAKLGLVKAMNDGSAVAAGFIGETFLQNPGTTASEHADAYTGALHWYGVAVGMGESQVHERATKLIQSVAGKDLDTQRTFMQIYNTGMEEGAARRRKP